MISRIVLASGLAAALLVPAANAATLVNADSATHSVTVTPKGGHKLTYKLPGHHHQRIDCKTGTTVMVGKSTMSCDAKTAKLFIKSGKLAL